MNVAIASAAMPTRSAVKERMNVPWTRFSSAATSVVALVPIFALI